MAESLYKSLLLIFLVLFADFSDVQCTELTFELPDKVEQCFYEDIKKDTKCILDFQVIWGGNYDVDLVMRGPNRKELYKTDRKKYDTIEFTAHADGEYEFCFSNQFSSFTHKRIYFDLITSDDDPPLTENIAQHQVALTQLETSIVKIHEGLKVVRDYQTHHRLREAQGKADAEYLNHRTDRLKRKRKTATPNNESNKRPSLPLRDPLPPLPPSLAKNPVGRDAHIIQGQDHMKSPKGLAGFMTYEYPFQREDAAKKKQAQKRKTLTKKLDFIDQLQALLPNETTLKSIREPSLLPPCSRIFGRNKPVAPGVSISLAPDHHVMNPISLPMRQEPLPRPSSHPLPTLNPPSHQLKKQSSHLESHQGNILDSLPMSSHHHHKPGVLTFPPPPGSTPTFQALSQGIVTPSSYSRIPHVHDVSPLLELCPDSCERSGDETTPPPAWRHVLSPKSHMKHHEWTSLHNKKPSAKSLKTSHASDHGIPIQYDSPSSYQPPPPLPATITQMSPIHTTNPSYSIEEWLKHVQHLKDVGGVVPPIPIPQYPQQFSIWQSNMAAMGQISGDLYITLQRQLAIVKQRTQALKETSSILTLTTAMKEGGGKMKPCNITLHGPPGVGKTSLKRVNLGQPPLPKEKQNATPIIENAARAVNTSRFTANGRKMLAEVNNHDLIKMLAKKAKSIHLNGNKPKEPDSTQQQHIPESESNSEFPTDLTTSETDSPLNTSNSETLRSIKEHLAEQVEPSTEIFDVDWIYLTDSGGQPQFQDVLPLLYHNESLHIVVTRLDEGLDDKPKIRYYNKGEDIYTLPDQLTLSNREIIERACQIAEAQATSRKFVPKVMIVGTHKDKLGINSEAMLKEINNELTKLHQKYSHVLIRKSKDEVIFAVNAMAPDGEERQQYTEELQDCILKAAEETRNEIDVPLKWLVFHLDIDKTGGIVRKSECYKTGEILGMGRSDVEEALKYFNKVGLLLYYPDDLPDLIFTKMDPLIGRLSRLITASFITKRCCCTAPYDRLRQKGLFNKSFLRTVFKDVYSCEEFNDDEFLKLLECLKIAIHVRLSDYFLPSALPLEPPSNDSSFELSCAPLVYSWDEQILPHGFFLTFVVELLQQQESGDKLYFELRDQVNQCRHVIQVIVVKNIIPGFLKLVDRKRWIEICYSCSTTKYCSKLQEITSDAVEKVVKRFEHTGIKSPRIGFRCRLCDTDDHYCSLSGDQRMVQCHQNNGPVTPDMSCWIGSSQSHLNTDYSPSNIFKRHMSEMLGVISDTERLANDLSSVDLISYQLKDDVLTTNLSRYQKASKLLNEIERSLRVFSKPETLISYCEVLRKQDNSALTRIAKDMLGSLTHTHIL